MKRSLLILSAVLLPSLAFALTSPAYDIQGVMGILCNILDYVFGLLMILALVFVLVAAFYYLTSSGEPEKVSTANKTLTWAAVAIVVALFARGFPFIIASVVQGSIQGGACGGSSSASDSNVGGYTNPNLMQGYFAPAPLPNYSQGGISNPNPGNRVLFPVNP